MSRQLTTFQFVGCYVTAGAILLPVCLALGATTKNSTGNPAVFPGSFTTSPGSSRSSYVLESTTPEVHPGSSNATPEIKSFKQDESLKTNSTGSEVEMRSEAKVQRSKWDSFLSKNSSINDFRSTASPISGSAFRFPEVERGHPVDPGNKNKDSDSRSTSGSSATSDLELSTSAISHQNCCQIGDLLSATTTLGNYDYNGYDEDDNDNNNNNDDDDNEGKEAEEKYNENNDDKGVYGYSDRSEEGQLYDDYRDNGSEEASDAGTESDFSRTEYLYVTDNITGNGSQIHDTQDLEESNSDYDYRRAEGEQWMDRSHQEYNGMQGNGIRQGIDYEAENRDYHLGAERHNFDIRLGNKLSDIRSGSHRGQAFSLRWLEHHPINHFAIFVWLVAALALAAVLLTAYRYRYSVINAIQYTRTNYKKGRRFGIEEANDLLSHAQV